FLLGLQVKQKEDGIYISQDKYVGEILKKIGFSSVRKASTPMETNKALTKDEDLKRIFRYLKGQPNSGLWYPKDSPFILEAFLNSDYAGASLDRKSTTGGCQFLGSRLVSLQCKKQTVVANSTTEAEYIAASHCCGQVLWIQNQMLDYGYNFMQTKIHVDNESAICVVKNPVYHSKTKHIEIRHHFIRDSYEKKLIEKSSYIQGYMIADLLTKAFDVTRFQFLIASIGSVSTAVYICIGVAVRSFICGEDMADRITVFSVLVVHHTTNGNQFTMSNRQERIGYSRANDNGSSKQGRMTKTEYEEVEYELDQTDTLQQITPTKVSQGEEQSQESSEVQLDVLSATKILADASRERVKAYKSYTRRRSTVSSRDSTAEEILSTDERIAQKLNEEEMAKAAAREDQEMIDFEKALELQK
ncbi:hypothetical protein Tco_0804921, partial [Tanacetum coccineum]